MRREKIVVLLAETGIKCPPGESETLKTDKGRKKKPSRRNQTDVVLQLQESSAKGHHIKSKQTADGKSINSRRKGGCSEGAQSGHQGRLELGSPKIRRKGA